MMNEFTVNIADFRGIREIKVRTASAIRSTAKASSGIMALETPMSCDMREMERSREVRSSAVFDIGLVRDAQRFGQQSVARRGAKVLRFTGAVPSTSQMSRGVATWSESCEDPIDSPPAA